MQTVQSSRLLKTALIADAAVSGAVALLQIVFGSQLSVLLGIAGSLLLATGWFLIAYTALLALLARSSRVWSWLLLLIIGGNVMWAAGCVLMIASSTMELSLLGTAFVAVQAVSVLVFAAWEYAGLRASTPVAQGRLSAA